MDRPIADRYVSVPLGMLSSSTDREVAEHRAGVMAAHDSGLATVLWRIHVLDLGPGLLGTYRAQFPGGVVTSICAVPIHELSLFKDENEVLLRGPFFQILDVVLQPGHHGAPGTHVVDAVMLNSNRDHVSTVATDENEDRRMRNLFRILVTLHRSTFAETFAADRGHDDDAEDYRGLRTRSEQELSDFMHQ